MISKRAAQALRAVLLPITPFVPILSRTPGPLIRWIQSHAARTHRDDGHLSPNRAASRLHAYRER